MFHQISPVNGINWGRLTFAFLRASGEELSTAHGRMMVNVPRSDGKLRGIGNRIKREILADTRQGDGTPTLIIGLISGLIWLFLVYVLPGQSRWDAKFLVVAICFASWGVADILPRSWLMVAALLRAAVFVFLLAFGAWILFDLIADF